MLLKNVALRNESKEIFSNYYQEVFLREDVLLGVKEAVAEGAYQGLANIKTIDKFTQFMINVVNTEIMRAGVMESFVYKPLKDAVSFFYGEE